jgi:hypothetical protein
MHSWSIQWTKYAVNKVSSQQCIRSTKYLVHNISCQSMQSMKYLVGKVFSWQSIQLTKYPVDKVSGKWSIQSTKYAANKVCGKQCIQSTKQPVKVYSWWSIWLANDPSNLRIFSGDEVDLKKLDLPHHDRRILERLYWKREQDKAAQELVALFGCSYFLPGWPDDLAKIAQFFEK